ncbi:hypothetical protein EYZ11_009898 [Aspergillus tanneri]|uniref:YWTD domain-containing protein n=1 Tax=Aspergillus tanneri TaxID=1220188 RepID=A0A4S3J6P6_9EURO|nr:uncharacterized protein ATNIH1004_007767 [Aspergillus tanneri]KAA8646340.1 hypothetical protein ATNIH1004_007767 [Aspergillus tanneri]THC90636.1 hypothetical protein EYZ11_009898 [Aspergillus tanneri]
MESTQPSALLARQFSLDVVTKVPSDMPNIAHPCTSSQSDEFVPIGKHKILVLDVGPAASKPPRRPGEILELSISGQLQRVLVRNLILPDGLDIDPSSNRMFWTCMGTPGKRDGTILSADLDGGNIRTVIAPGAVNTPKQLAIVPSTEQLYFCDREGLGVWRCKFDGSCLERLIQTADEYNSQDASNGRNWCVGVAVAPRLGKIFWTQKGPSKGGSGRIFSANLDSPTSPIVESRKDVQCILSGLPEPIDLKVDESSHTLYWTDRGEQPFGNTLNKALLDEAGMFVPVDTSMGYEILAQDFNEAIGLDLDPTNRCAYVTDLGGTLYRCDLNTGHKESIHIDPSRRFTGVRYIYA